MALEGRTVAVVGGGSGIGKATVRASYAAGANVVVAGRSEGPLHQLASALGARARTLTVDITSDGSVDRFCEELGAIDHLVVTASAVTVGEVRKLAIGHAIESMNSKFWGPYRLVRGASIRDRGSVVLISGALSRRPQRGLALLGAINAAVEALGRGLALEMAPTRVNVVCPGLIDTEAYSKMPPEQRQKHLESGGARVPVGRAGRPEEAAAAVMFALTNEFVTGSVIDVDGGAQVV